MSALILSGKPIAETIKSEVSAEVARLRSNHHFRPCLVAVRVGNDPASAIYVGNKVRTTEEVGMKSGEHHLPAETTQDQLLAIVGELNRRIEVDGILVQLPLPPQIDEHKNPGKRGPAKGR